MPDVHAPLSPKDWITHDGRRITGDAGLAIDAPYGFTEMTLPFNVHFKRFAAAKERPQAKLHDIRLGQSAE